MYLPIKYYTKASLYSDTQFIMDESFVQRLFEKEKMEFKEDLQNYTDEVKKEEFIRYKIKKNEQNYKLEKRENTLFEKVLASTTIQSEFILLKPLSDIVENYSELRKMFEEHKDIKDKTFYYITKAKYGDNPEHWFLTIQKSKDIYVIDPLSSTERRDFFDAFIGGLSQFNYYRNSQRLQYSSGVCEIFTVKLAFYLARLESFNIINSQFKGVFINKKSEAELLKEQQPNSVMFNQLHPVLVNALNEFSFGKFVSKDDISLDLRIKNLVEQRTRLMDDSLRLIQFKPKTSFAQFLVRDLNLSLKVIEELDKQYTIVNSKNELNKTNLIRAVKELLNITDDDKRTEYITILVDNTSLKYGGCTEDYNSEMYKNINQEEFEEVTTTINKVLFEKTKDMTKRLLGIGYIDFSNPYTSLKAGHMYFEALRYQQVLEDMRESEEENYRNSNPETFKLEYI